MVTRRTTQRQFLLKPSKAVNGAFRYCLALAARRTKIQIHGYCVLSNHYHLICTDPLGELPAFVEHLNKLVARCLNCHYGRWENFWDSTQASYVRLGDENAVIDKLSYALANPVAAGLVPYGNQWPGERVWHPGSYIARRPEFFFKPSGSMPERLPLKIVAPRLIAAGTNVLNQIEKHTRSKELKVRREFRRTDKRFLGAAAVKRQKHSGCPRQPARRGLLSPTVASRDKWRRVELLQTLQSFLTAYREAMVAWLAGRENVTFPAGVYQMRVRFHVACIET